MKASAQNSTRDTLLIFALLVLLAVASRLMWHPPNFTALDAIAVFAGARLLDRKLALLMPLLALAISDLALELTTGFGFHGGMWVVYLCMGFTVWLGMLAAGRGRLAMFGAGVLGATVFFVVTNLAVWLGSGMYSLDSTGLASCFALALPFYKYQLAGVMVYLSLLLALEHVRSRVSAKPVPQIG
jgi:hypothetical protein